MEPKILLPETLEMLNTIAKNSKLGQNPSEDGPNQVNILDAISDLDIDRIPVKEARTWVT